MNAADFLDAILPEYRAEIGPIVGFDFIDRFVVQNRARLLRSLEPLMEMLAAERVPPAATPEACQACGTELEPMGAHGIGCPRCADVEIDELDRAQQVGEDPDAVTPEKDAIVWAAFTNLVNQKRREIGMDEIEATESLPRFGGKSVGRINDRGWGSEVATDKMTTRARALSNREYDRRAQRRVEQTGPVLSMVGTPVGDGTWDIHMERSDLPTAHLLHVHDPHGGPVTTQGVLSEMAQVARVGDTHYREDIEALVSRQIKAFFGDAYGMLLSSTLPWRIRLRLREARARARGKEQMESLPSCGCGPTRSEMAESLPKPGRSRRSATDRKMDDLAAKYGMTREEWLADSDKWWNSSPDTKPIAITMRHNRRRDLVALVTASASEPGRFQVTWVDNEGPSGHTTRDTPEEAVRYAVEEGYRLDDATTNARDRDLVERVQRAHEARAAEIDSWVTESLPRRDLLHPKELTAAIHHFAPFKRGDYVIRLGDMLGMEGELGGYVMAINRNEGTAKIEQDNGEIKPWPLDSLLHDTKENRAKREAFDDQIAADASVRVDQAVLEWKAR